MRTSPPPADESEKEEIEHERVNHENQLAPLTTARNNNGTSTSFRDEQSIEFKAPHTQFSDYHRSSRTFATTPKIRSGLVTKLRLWTFTSASERTENQSHHSTVAANSINNQ
jgi:hypothetical protein